MFIPVNTYRGLLSVSILFHVLLFWQREMDSLPSWSIHILVTYISQTVPSFCGSFILFCGLQTWGRSSSLLEWSFQNTKCDLATLWNTFLDVIPRTLHGAPAHHPIRPHWPYFMAAIILNVHSITFLWNLSVSTPLSVCQGVSRVSHLTFCQKSYWILLS